MAKMMEARNRGLWAMGVAKWAVWVLGRLCLPASWAAAVGNWALRRLHTDYRAGQGGWRTIHWADQGRFIVSPDSGSIELVGR